MARLIYNVLIFFFKSAISFASLFNKKARSKIDGVRKSKSIIDNFTNTCKGGNIFIHCASQGEHEQALPIIRWVIENTKFNIALSFSSPSGFQNVDYQKNQRICKFYLPFDTVKEMAHLVTSLQPEYAIIIKNEWWWNLLASLQHYDIETYLVSATIRNNHYFIKNKNPFFTNRLKAFKSVFVVDEDSKMNFAKAYHGNIIVAGDTRVDQVNYSKNSLKSNLAHNARESMTIVYGSVWNNDVQSIRNLVERYPNAVHLIYPHELSLSNINHLKDSIAANRLIEYTKDANPGINIITSMGELKFAYDLATFAYIGGGLGAGIHNVLEAAVYYIPTVFGPNYHKSNEAKYLISTGCSFTFQNVTELERICKKIEKEKIRKEIETKLKAYFSPKYSPSEIICKAIFEKKHINV